MASSRPAGPTDRFLVGPHLQIWWTGRVWSGIGPVGGVIVSRYTNTGLIGAELRAGFAFPLRGRSTISPSLEVMRIAGIGPGQSDMTALAFVLGYQYR